MTHRRRMLGTAVGAFLVGGLSVGLALWAAGAVPVTESGVALGAFLFFPVVFKIFFGIFFFMLLFRLIGGGFGGRRGHWGPWASEGDPRGRMQAWHEHAHAETAAGDKNATSEDSPGS